MTNREDDTSLSSKALQRIVLPRDPPSVSMLRHEIAALVDGLPVTVDRRYDVQLAASELVANAVEHGAGDTVTIRIGVAGARFVISVENRTSRPLPDRATWGFGDAHRPAGRGLAIVASISDGVEVREGNGVTIVTTWFDIAGPDPGPR